MVTLLDMSDDILESILQLTLDKTENDEERNVQIRDMKHVCKRFASIVRFKKVHTAKQRHLIVPKCRNMPMDSWLAFLNWLSRHGNFIEALDVIGAFNPNDILNILQSNAAISSLVVHIDRRSLPGTRITHSIGPNLKHLELTGHCFLETPLFDGLRTLKLGENVTVRPSFKFPASLEKLDAHTSTDWNPILTYGTFESLVHLGLEHVPQVLSTPFPSTLQSLCLGSAGRFDTLKLKGHAFPLPPHLTTLELALSYNINFSTYIFPENLVRVQLFSENTNITDLSKIPSTVRDLSVVVDCQLPDEDAFSLGTQLRRFKQLESLTVGEMCLLDDNFYESLALSRTLSSLWVYIIKEHEMKIPLPSSLKNLALWGTGPSSYCPIDSEVLLRTHLNILAINADIGPIWSPDVRDMWKSLNTLVIRGVELLETLFPEQSWESDPINFADQHPHLTIIFDLTELSEEERGMEDCEDIFEHLRCIAPLVERVILSTTDNVHPDEHVLLRDENADESDLVQVIQEIIPHAQVDIIIEHNLAETFCTSRGFDWMKDIQYLKECPRHTSAS